MSPGQLPKSQLPLTQMSPGQLPKSQLPLTQMSPGQLATQQQLPLTQMTTGQLPTPQQLPLTQITSVPASNSQQAAAESNTEPLMLSGLRGGCRSWRAAPRPSGSRTGDDGPTAAEAGTGTPLNGIKNLSQ